MLRQHEQTIPNPRLASLLLSFVAGYVDSCTFLALFGIFVAQLTGSFVDAGAHIAKHGQALLLARIAVPVFLFAGAATTLLVMFVANRRAPASPLAWSLMLEAALLIGFFAAFAIGSPFGEADAPWAVAAGLLGLSAMGVQSALVQLLMRGTPSTNVMTTNTTTIAILGTKAVLDRYAHRNAARAAIAAHDASTRERLTGVLLVAAGFLTGTIAGTIAYSAADTWCLLVPIAIILGLMIRSLQAPSTPRNSGWVEWIG
jgi:uncharacterized membrane protein YoaK (UPF0700 family)